MTAASQERLDKLSVRAAKYALSLEQDGFYNPIRRHSTLGYQSPVQFEMAGRE